MMGLRQREKGKGSAMKWESMSEKHARWRDENRAFWAAHGVTDPRKADKLDNWDLAVIWIALWVLFFLFILLHELGLY